MKRIAAVLAVLLCLLAAVPVRAEALTVDAASSILMEKKTGQVL